MNYPVMSIYVGGVRVFLSGPQLRFEVPEEERAATVQATHGNTGQELELSNGPIIEPGQFDRLKGTPLGQIAITVTHPQGCGVDGHECPGHIQTVTLS